jgi:hypothetical protein
MSVWVVAPPRFEPIPPSQLSLGIAILPHYVASSFLKSGDTCWSSRCRVAADPVHLV